MERINTTPDANSLPVHLFVKSPKQAKKIDRRMELTETEPIVFKKNKNFKPFGVNLLP